MADESIENKPIQLEENQLYLPIQLMNIILKETDIHKEVAEERNSELWYDTFHGTGKAIFPLMTYTGALHCGILDSRIRDKSTTTAAYTTAKYTESESKVEFVDGTVYQGTIHNNLIEGKGKFTFPTGSTYEGYVKNGLRDGYGVFENKAQGVKYEGEWKEGVKEGIGILINSSRIYEGSFHKGIIDGSGKIKWKSGNYYNGQMSLNKIEGNGFMIWVESNEKYTGQWKNNLQNGFGVHVNYEPKGEIKMLRNRYIGEWKNGQRNGYGVYYYSNGSKYEGFWVNNCKEGFGIKTLLDRTQIIGEFKEDNIVKDINSNVEKSSQNPIVPVSKPSNNESFLKQQNERDIREKDHTMHLDLSDLILTDNNISDSLKEINNLLLRNLSEISHWYLMLNGRENIKDLMDLATTGLNESKISFYNANNIPLSNTIVQGNANVNLNQQALPGTNNVASSNNKDNNNINANVNEEKKVMDPVNFDTILNNDVSFCLELRDVWKFLKEYGFINLDCTIAEFNRIFFQGSKNYYNMFFIPEILPEEGIYDYLYSIISQSKYDFEWQYYDDIISKNPDAATALGSNQTKEHYSQIAKMPISYNIHHKQQIILLKQFYEVLIRIAYYKFYYLPTTLDAKLKTVIQVIKPIIRQRRKAISVSKADISMNNSSFFDFKLKGTGTHFEVFLVTYENNITNIFNDLYTQSTIAPNENDKTITHRFFYNKIISRIPQLKSLMNSKLSYCDWIIRGLHTNNNATLKRKSIKDEINNADRFKQSEELLDCEMICFEFIELVFGLTQKYSIMMSKDEDFDEIISMLRTCTEHPSISKKRIGYCYPKLNAHYKIEELERIRIQKEYDNKMRLLEIERYMRVRKELHGEDSNAYNEEMDKTYSSEEEDDY